VWVVRLDNNLIVYQDDYRPNIKEPMAWRRLGSYILESGASIVHMKLKFRSNEIVLPSHAKGYYFAHGAVKDFSDGVTRGYFVCGAWVGSDIEINWYDVPALTVFDTKHITYTQAKKPFLIKNPR